jgi:hypothetical protein
VTRNIILSATNASLMLMVWFEGFDDRTIYKLNLRRSDVNERVLYDTLIENGFNVQGINHKGGFFNKRYELIMPLSNYEKFKLRRLLREKWGIK